MFLENVETWERVRETLDTPRVDSCNDNLRALLTEPSKHVDPLPRLVAAVEKLPTKERIVACGEALRWSTPGQAVAWIEQLVRIASRDPFDMGAGPVRQDGRIDSIWHRIRVAFSPSHRWAVLAARELARRWAHVPPEQREIAIGTERGGWAAHLAEEATDPDPDIRLSAAMLAGDSGEASCGVVCVSLLNDESPEVVRAAERSLFSLAVLVLRDNRGGDYTPLLEPLCEVAPRPLLLRRSLSLGLRGEARALAEALAQGVKEAGEHRRRGVLVGVLTALDRVVERRDGSGAFRALRELVGSHPGVAHMARGAMRRSRFPLIRARSVEWLGVPGVSAGAIDRLRAPATVMEHEYALRVAHLTVRPRRRAALAGLTISGRPGGASLVPAPGQIGSLSVEARRGIGRLLAPARSERGAKRRAIEPMLVDPDAAARFGAGVAVSPGVMPDWCFDSHWAIARHQVYARSGGASPDRSTTDDLRILERLVGSPHSAVSTAAREDLELHPLGHRATLGVRLQWRRRLRAEPGPAVERLGELLRSGDRDVRMRALMLVRRLDLASVYDQELLRLLHAGLDDAHTDATIVSIVGALDTPAGAAAREAGLRHADARVRANTIEACSRLSRHTGGALPASVVEGKGDGPHRIRAAAVRAGLGACIAGVGDDLASLLTDHRAEHRLAGAWLSGRALPHARAALGERWPEMAARVAELAGGDPDARVRARAGVSLRRLEADLQAHWTGSTTWLITPAMEGGALA